jgi:cyanophycinase
VSLYAFLGAGEFEDWHRDVDGLLLDGRAGDVLVLATASAPEGDAIYQGWVDKGLGHYQRGGIGAKAPGLRVRDDAHDPAIVAALDDAAAVFFSGGNPAYLASVLAGSPFWARLQERIAEGTLAYAGCSAGVACLSDPTFDSATDDVERVWAPGLGYFPSILFGPHWDIVDMWIPGARAFIAAATPVGGHLVGIDEETAIVGDGTEWTVRGKGGVYLHHEGAWIGEYRGGESFTLPMTAAVATPATDQAPG